MTAARRRTAAELENARWCETGPKLIAELQTAYEADLPIAPRQSCYAIGSDEFSEISASGSPLMRSKSARWFHIRPFIE
jgi:hypothetical protein